MLQIQKIFWKFSIKIKKNNINNFMMKIIIKIMKLNNKNKILCSNNKIKL